MFSCAVFTCAVLHVLFYMCSFLHMFFYICFLVYCHLTNIYEPVYVIVFSCCLCVWVCFAQAVLARENMKAKYCNLCDLWLNGRFKFVQHLKRCKHHKNAHFWIFTRYRRLCYEFEVEAARQDKKKRTLRERLRIKQKLFEIVHCRCNLTCLCGKMSTLEPGCQRAVHNRA